VANRRHWQVNAPDFLIDKLILPRSEKNKKDTTSNGWSLSEDKQFLIPKPPRKDLIAHAFVRFSMLTLHSPLLTFASQQRPADPSPDFRR
jgi:hypothetical protein